MVRRPPLHSHLRWRAGQNHTHLLCTTSLHDDPFLNLATDSVTALMALMATRFQ
ncbi:MAG TPA: hypothetical protein VFX24_10105 [Ktedonobacterales bacterium]|nr:hypothetical protein [Ktedonobacterales bacterium]